MQFAVFKVLQELIWQTDRLFLVFIFFLRLLRKWLSVCQLLSFPFSFFLSFRMWESALRFFAMYNYFLFLFILSLPSSVSYSKNPSFCSSFLLSLNFCFHLPFSKCDAGWLTRPYYDCQTEDIFLFYHLDDLLTAITKVKDWFLFQYLLSNL